jgi:hypothetical protein
MYFTDPDISRRIRVNVIDSEAQAGAGNGDFQPAALQGVSGFGSIVQDNLGRGSWCLHLVVRVHWLVEESG